MAYVVFLSFAGLFGTLWLLQHSRNAKRRKRARKVIAIAEIAATTSHKTLLDAFPSLTELVTGEEGFRNWRFFCTVGAVGAQGYMASGPDVPKNEQLGATRATVQVLGEWDHQGRGAYADLLRFVGRTIEGGSVSTEAAVGAWVMWNVKGAEPTSTQMAAGAALGVMLFHAMAEALG